MAAGASLGSVIWLCARKEKMHTLLVRVGLLQPSVGVLCAEARRILRLRSRRLRCPLQALYPSHGFEISRRKQKAMAT